MTFSLVARCKDTGMFGVVISSSSPAVAARCSYARAGVGAVASQNVTDPTLGPLGLDLMDGGMTAVEAVAEIQRRGAFIDYRQVLVVDANLLANADVPKAIVDGFLAAKGHIGDRLIAAMRAGLAAGGEAGPVHSAGMKIVDKVSWPVADLRCDWTEDDPIEAIATAWDIYKPQLDAYIQRALDPRAAPSYGVPGDQ
jgi:uncharacterized Ntn-hydrolase superfamily protein